MKNIAERAVDCAEESNKIAKTYDEIIPAYFFLGYTLGEEKFKLNEIKDIKLREMLMELYNKGMKFVKDKTVNKFCKKCNKPINLQEAVKFCQFCGEKIV